MILRKLDQGYIVGNPVTDEDEAANERIPYVHRMALISDQQFEVLNFNRGCYIVVQLEFRVGIGYEDEGLAGPN